ncbi:MAG: hypothetical protein NC206_10530 [Bacteroides sp.]|nr:hypothetical protein [Roseburia sp.]MCM1347503.1 hypothetical protein [Bacteroides sp.]MCM1421636.1 hypothetical protein [Bacteroides sp.]
MKKLIILLSVVFSAGSIVSRAQDVPMAVLQSGDNTQCFYGSGSFKEACEAADHGDVITLSSGVFLAPTVTKAVSIFGSGADLVPDTIEKPLTRINGDIHIAVDSVDGKPAQGLYVEGIFSDAEVWVEHRLEYATFAKCRFKNFNFFASADTSAVSSEMCSFYQCRFSGYLEPADANALAVHNSVIQDLGTTYGSSTVNIYNCVLFNTSEWIGNAMFKNSYLYAIRFGNFFHSKRNTVTSSNVYKLNSSCSAFNCLDSYYAGSSNVSSKFYNLPIKMNLYTNGGTTIYSPFKTSTTSYSDTDSYELSDEAKEKYLGTDGNPICLYGGDYPYTTTSSIPYVVEKNIATKSENGKLKVSVKVAVPGASL